MIVMHDMYIVKWRTVVSTDSGIAHEHDVTLRVAAPDLDAVLRTLRLSGSEWFECALDRPTQSVPKEVMPS